MTSDCEDTETMPGGLRDLEMGDRAERAKQDAVRWLSLMSSGRATEADAQALKQWCREDPAHEAAYARMALVWDMLTPLAARVAHKGDADQLPAHSTQFGRRAFLGGAIATAACAAGYLVIQPPLELWPSLAELRADIRTGTGEQRRIAVAEGIGVELNTLSSLSFRAPSNGDHRIELISGEAVVAAGPEATAACTVFAGDGRIRTQNAKVDIRNDGAEIRVTCLEGSVRVEHGGQAVTVAAQQQVAYGERGLSGIGAIDPTTVTAWQQGLLVFRQKPLSHVIEEVNRYRPGEIVLLNQALGRHLIDARFRLDHLENVITYLRQAFDARVAELPGGIVLVS